MGELKTIGKNRFRIYCDCGKFVHEISRDDEGKLVFESMGRNPKASTPADDTLAATPKPKKPKGGWGIFEDEEKPEEGEE
jgi:hypothetical protein